MKTKTLDTRGGQASPAQNRWEQLGRLRWALIVVVVIALLAINALYHPHSPAPPEPEPSAAAAAAAPASAPSPPERLAVKILSVRPHDPESFTQGLLLQGGSLYESAGNYGKSSLREVDP
ncbi:MAG TPA: glutaminyl-peptide cyclotransferase, partial [Thermoanaerobaculia bacterium]|nr:glutaminyl-peptide cyclotransferase [Thermoanaerobaculia bacterium]